MRLREATGYCCSALGSRCFITSIMSCGPITAAGPFTPRVTPFTFSLAVYVFMIAALMLRTRPWLRLAIMVPVFGFAQFAHMGMETPHDQYNTWAAGISDFADAFGQPNLLGIASPTAGYFAVVLSVSLSLALLATLWSLWMDARASGRA
jgi:hypothetical protein